MSNILSDVVINNPLIMSYFLVEPWHWGVGIQPLDSHDSPPQKTTKHETIRRCVIERLTLAHWLRRLGT